MKVWIPGSQLCHHLSPFTSFERRRRRVRDAMRRATVDSCRWPLLRAIFCDLFLFFFHFSPSFSLGFRFVRDGECVEDVMLLRMKMHVHNSISSSVRYSYSVIIPRRVVDVFGPCFLLPSCLPCAFPYPCYCTILLSLRIGPPIAVSRVRPGFCDFLPSPICFLLYLYNLIHYSMLLVSPSPSGS